MPVEVYVFADDDPAHLSFTKRYLRVFPYQLRAAWDRAVFTGSGMLRIRWILLKKCYRKYLRVRGDWLYRPGSERNGKREGRV